MIDRLFRERLDALNDPLDPGFGFDLIRLSASRTEIVVQQQRDLDANVHDNDELAALIDRIAARIGGKRVVVHLPQDTHIPERAVLAVPAQHHLAAAAQAAWPARTESEPPLRPLRLFEKPEPIKVPFATVPDGPPHHFTWRRATHAVVRVEGPERIAMEWWKQDGKALTRDYFRVEDEAGLRFWIFRDGLYDSETGRRGGRAGSGQLVRARAVRMNVPLCRNRHHHEFLVPARRLGSARLCASGERLRLPAIGIADHNTLAGVVRAYKELDNPEVQYKPKLLIGSRLVFIDGTPDILVYPRDRAAYGRLCQLLTRGKRGDDIQRIEKGECHLRLDDLLEFAEGQLLVLTLPHRFDAAGVLKVLDRLKSSRADGVWLAASLLYRGDDRRRLARLHAIAAKANVPLLATNEVLYHHPARRPLQDVLTCIREKTTIDAVGKRLEANAERYLKPAPRNGAVVSRSPGGDRGDHALCRPHLIFARSAQIPVSGRAGAAGQDRAAASGRPDLGGRRQIFRRRHRRQDCAPPCARNST